MKFSRLFTRSHIKIAAGTQQWKLDLKSVFCWYVTERGFQPSSSCCHLFIVNISTHQDQLKMIHDVKMLFADANHLPRIVLVHKGGDWEASTSSVLLSYFREVTGFDLTGLGVDPSKQNAPLTTYHIADTSPFSKLPILQGGEGTEMHLLQEWLAIGSVLVSGFTH